MTRYAGKPLFEENFPPHYDTVTSKYIAVPQHRFVMITEKEAAQLAVPTPGLQYGVTMEGDGQTYGSPMLKMATVGDYAATVANTGGSNLEMTVRMAGTALVASAVALQRGDYVSCDATGRLTKTTPANALGQVKEDAAIGSLVKVRFNGMGGYRGV